MPQKVVKKTQWLKALKASTYLSIWFLPQHKRTLHEVCWWPVPAPQNTVLWSNEPPPLLCCPAGQPSSNKHKGTCESCSHTWPETSEKYGSKKNMKLKTQVTNIGCCTYFAFYHNFHFSWFHNVETVSSLSLEVQKTTQTSIKSLLVHIKDTETNVPTSYLCYYALPIFEPSCSQNIYNLHSLRELMKRNRNHHDKPSHGTSYI